MMLMAKDYRCSQCNKRMREVKSLRKIDDEWYCPNCRKKKLAKNTIKSVREIFVM